MQRNRKRLTRQRLAQMVLIVALAVLAGQHKLSAGFLIFYAKDVTSGQTVLMADNLTTTDQISAPGTAFDGLNPTFDDDDPLVGLLISNQQIALQTWKIDAGLTVEATSQIDPDPEFAGVSLFFNVTNESASGDPAREIMMYATRMMSGTGINIGSRLQGTGVVTDGAASTDFDFIGGMSLAGTAFDTSSASISLNPTLTIPNPSDGTNGILFDQSNAAPATNVGGPISLTVGGNFTLSPDQFLNVNFLSFESPTLQEAVPEPGILALLATAFVTGGGSHLLKRFRRCKSGKDPVTNRSI